MGASARWEAVRGAVAVARDLLRPDAISAGARDLLMVHHRPPRSLAPRVLRASGSHAVVANTAILAAAGTSSAHSYRWHVFSAFEVAHTAIIAAAAALASPVPPVRAEQPV